MLYHPNQILLSQLLPLVICSCQGLPSATLCHQFQSLVFLYSISHRSEGSEEIHFSNVTRIPQQYVGFVSICVVSSSLVCQSYQEVVKWHWFSVLVGHWFCVRNLTINITACLYCKQSRVNDSFCLC